jgi:geranylgeranyl diphosphate synthase type I
MEHLAERRAAVEQRLAAAVERVDPPELEAHLEAVALAGGKRVRPTLTLLAFEAAGGSPAEHDTAMDFAVGVELVHNASLVVDDIIDRSTVRRGEPSAWAAFGHGGALIASDGLLGEAFALFSADARAMETVADAMVELGEGEAIELVDRPDSEAAYLELARRKTGALFRAAAELGAIAAGADPEVVDALGEYAERVGVAFQIRDDVLDAVGDTDSLGKPAGRDAEMDRPSILRVTEKSPEAVTAVAREQADAARAALDRLNLADGSGGGDGDEEAKRYLAALAEFVVERER